MAVATATPCCDLDEIRASAKVLLKPGAVHELRIPNTRRGTVSGYYDDLSRLAEDAAQWSGRAPGVYVTLNPANPDLLARSANRVREWAKYATSDADIVQRHWLPIDLDAARPSGISSTDQEHEAALTRGRLIVSWLTERGFPTPIVGDSGNGGHLLYPIDLPNDDRSRVLTERCLKALALWFDDDVVKVDAGTFNAARIWKIYSTLAAKGDNLAERPHRLARLLEIPDSLEAVSVSLLEELAAMIPLPSGNDAHRSNGDKFDASKWLETHGLEVARVKPWQRGTLYELAVCPWNSEHKRSARVIQLASGALSAACFHNSCATYRWHDLRQMIDPNRASTFSTYSGTNGNSNTSDDQMEQTLDDEAERGSEPVTFPEAGWRGPFADYRAAMVGTSEAPDCAHFAALWATAAAHLRRRVSIFYAYPHYPNVYLVNIGLTGDSKTSAMRAGLKLLPSDGRVRLLRGAGSAEALADWMAQQEEGRGTSHLLFLEELGTLLVRGGWEGSTLLSFLTETFDAPELYEVPFRKNPVKVAEPTPVLLAGTTPEWFWKSMREIDFHGGFGNRLFFFSGSQKAPIPMPARPDPIRLQSVSDALAGLDQCPSGEMHLTPEALELWRGFYLAWKQTIFSPLTAAATKRAPTYALKLALVYAAFEGSAPEITADQIAAAIQVARFGVACADALITHRGQFSHRGRCEEAIIRALTRDDLAPWRIHHRIGGRFTAEDVARALRALQATGSVLQVAKTGRGEPVYGLRGRKREA